jgi:hypothetical protein
METGKNCYEERTMKDLDPKIESLINALDDTRDGLRQFAIRRLVNEGDRAVAALIGTLKSHNVMVQESAAIALVTMGNAALPKLMLALKSDDSALQWGAAWVLSSMPPEIRSTIPKVDLPDSNAKMEPAKVDSSVLHGVWSDSWLTKIRQTLKENRVLPSIDFQVLDAPPRLTC